MMWRGGEVEMKTWAYRVLYLCPVLLAGLPSKVSAQQRCYTLVNGTSSTVHVAFYYPQGMPLGDHVISIDMQPGGRLPDCFDPGTSSTAVVYGFLWQGQATCQLASSLEMGFTNLASSPGTYTITTQPRSCGGGGGGSGDTPPRHRELTDADCKTSDVIPDGVYTIKNSSRGDICLGFDVAGTSLVKLGTCDGTQNRLFTFGRRGDGCYFVRNGDVTGPPSGRCMDSPSGRDRRSADSPLNALACNDTKYQRWRLYKLPSGKYNIMNKDSGQCVNIKDGNKIGDNAEQYDCNGQRSAEWSIDYVRPR
jgi:hypothetical protein